MVGKEYLENVLLHRNNEITSENYQNQLFKNLENLTKGLQKSKDYLSRKMAESW